MKPLDMVYANTNIDSLMASYYPNVTSSNTGVILEIRRERTIELVMEGFRLWDIIRWKEGQELTKTFEGCYFPGPGLYDLNNDGKNDFQIYTDSKGTFTGTSMKLDKDIFLSNKTSGYVLALQKLKQNGMKIETIYGQFPCK